VEGPLVETIAGKLRGATNDHGVHVFKGVRYAQPAVGTLRFKPPVPVAPWTGERPALENTRPCPQAILAMGPGGSAVIPPPFSEDCLSVDVTTASLEPNARQPVLVWLHGGAWSNGCSTLGPTDGTKLALEDGIVVVTVNLRIGVMGLLYLERLLSDEFAGSGNAGVLDMVEALRWVKGNIAAFGGDPDNVTIAGESGTGNKVLALMGTPAAAGLFNRGLALSGALLRLVEADVAADFAERVVQEAGVAPSELQSVPFERLIDAQVAVVGGPIAGIRLGLGPVLDGHVYPSHPFSPGMAPSVADVPLIIGSGKDEGTMLLRQIGDGSDDALDTWLDNRMRPITGGETDRLIDAYRNLRPGISRVDGAVAARSDLMRVPIVRTAERKADAGRAPTYLFLCGYESTPEFKAGHADGVQYFFGNVDGPMSSKRDDRHAMSDVMRNTLVAFARSGNPNHDAIPDWPPFTTAERQTMVFDVPSRVERDPLGVERELWAELDVGGW
jgi:para-nitrobenzyl esterase